MTETPQPSGGASVDLRRLSPLDASRLVEIVFTFARHGLLVVGRQGPLLVLAPGRRTPRAAAVAIRRSFTDLGPTFVKLGQLIASSPGLFPDTLAGELRRLLDRLPAEPAGRVRTVIANDLGQPVESLFASFDDEPIAAASIAQVHEAYLPDGTRVAVKVRRPRLRGRVERDLRLLRLLAAVAQHGGALGRLANPVGVVEDFAGTIRAELDFRNEAAAMVEFERDLRASGGNERVRVPAPIEGMVTARVLVMTFLEGTPVDDEVALRAAGHDLEELLRTGVRAWLEAALEHGLFHGDVHAGNLLVTPHGEVGFLDFGIMGRLEDRTRAALRRTLPAVLVEQDFTKAVEGLFQLRLTDGPVDLEAAAADVRGLVGPLLDRPLSEISYAEVLGHVLRVATAHRVRLPQELVLVIKQLLYFERYSKRLAPDYALLADQRILGQLLGPASTLAEAQPRLSVRPRTRPLDSPEGGLAVERGMDNAFSWAYDAGRPELTRLYEKAKRSQWNAEVDIDWSVDVDPLDTGGLADYLPMVAAESFGRFNDRERAEAAYHFNAWITSQFLHGEQGALLATAKLVRQVPGIDAKHYGATQVYDEARHVEVYARYLQEKLELVYPANPNLQHLLELVVADPRWDVTYLGMQIIVEGLALAAFGLIHQFSSEPLIKQITRYVMADEARHVAFGALSLTGLYDEMTEAERREREDFVLEAAWLMRDRFLAEEVWERLGIPATDGLRDSSTSPMLRLFQQVLFAKITPNLNKIGLLSDDLRRRLAAIGAIAGD